MIAIRDDAVRRGQDGAGAWRSAAAVNALSIASAGRSSHTHTEAGRMAAVECSPCPVVITDFTDLQWQGAGAAGVAGAAGASSVLHWQHDFFAGTS